MKKNNLMFLVLVFIAMTSCKSTYYTARQVDVNRHNIGQTENAVKVIPNYEKQITASSMYQTSRVEAMREAEYKCIENNKDVDVIVDPIFQIEYNPLRAKKRYLATVSGFAGMYEETPAGVNSTMSYTREQIENYKLLYDPNFAQFLYSQSEGDKYYFGDITTAPERRSIMLAAQTKKTKALKVYDYSKALKLRDTGIGFTIGGILSTLVIGVPCYVTATKTVYKKVDNGYYDSYRGKYVDNSYYVTTTQTNYASWSTGVAFMTIGSAAVVAGIPMWAVGSHRIKKSSNVDLNIGVTSSGVGARLTF